MNPFRETAAKTALGVALAIASPCVCPASFDGGSKGTSGAQFLKLGAGARAFGMGEAYSAVADDSTAIYWNPAALVNAQGHSVSLMHASLFGEINYQFLGYSMPVNGNSAFGAGIQYLSAGTIKETDSSGIETGTNRNPSDMAASIGYAYRAGDWSFGMAGKYIRSTLVNTASAIAADFGVLSPKLLNEKLRLAFVAQNIGTKMKFDAESDPLPMNIKFGSYFLISDRLLAALDVNFPNDNSPYAGAGCEYGFFDDGNWRFAGRAGYNTRTLGQINGLTGASIGAGAGFGSGRLDYAFMPFGDLGTVQRISLGILFGKAGHEYTGELPGSEYKREPPPPPPKKINRVNKKSKSSGLNWVY